MAAPLISPLSTHTFIYDQAVISLIVTFGGNRMQEHFYKATWWYSFVGVSEYRHS